MIITDERLAEIRLAAEARYIASLGDPVVAEIVTSRELAVIAFELETYRRLIGQLREKP